MEGKFIKTIKFSGMNTVYEVDAQMTHLDNQCDTS